MFCLPGETNKLFLNLRFLAPLGSLQDGSLCCSSTYSKDLSSKTTGPISVKFHMQPPGNGGKKVYSFGLGHLTNMAAMLI